MVRSVGDEIKITSAEDFAPEVYALQLPSGRGVEIKEPDLVNIVVAGDGDVPDFISGMVLSGLNGRGKAPNLKVDENNLGEMFKFIDVIVQAAVVSHKVVKANADRKKGEINITDLSSEDKLTIWNAAMPLEAGAALSFRQRVEAANLGDVSDRKDNGDETEHNPDDSE